ncbi:hypothetical protein RI049_07170 [Cedecea neteri]|uniref:hypothetical protein n=1 Tax=Cedecea neteri TaxID=158822 RepID=UPI002AA839F9|nr:hypothetical protein [Cedecea neteri]WPU24525.1 hypothetical protein RI049_07170 [Cedecea neteri]
MSAGTLTLTNNSAAVTGVGTAFSTDISAGDFIVVTVGGVPYTLPVKSVDSATALTLVSIYTGPTQSGSAWSAVPRVTLNMVTAALVAQSAEALRGLNYDKQNWQAVFSASGDITVTMPDGTQFTGPSWQKVIQMLHDIDLDEVQVLAEQVNNDARQVSVDKEASVSAASSAANSAITATGAKDSAVSANLSAQEAKADAEASKLAAQQAASTIDTAALLRKDGNLSGLSDIPASRKNLGLKTAAVADILGIVSMSGGAPAGAIIETGNNANGTYTKFADGAMICIFRDTAVMTANNVNGPLFYSEKTLTFPASFSSPPSVSGGNRWGGSGGVGFVSTGTVSSTSCSVVFLSGLQNSTGYVSYTAIGRWF